MIAVVIPCFNEFPDRIAATVASAQEVGDLVVLVDDGSITPAEAGCVVVRTENRGPAAAMNTGAEVAIAKGAFVLARIDVGDTFRVDAKRKQIAAFQGGAMFSPYHDLVRRCDVFPPAHWQSRIYTDGMFCICTMLVDVPSWRAVGGFDESLRYCDDWDFTIRVQHEIGWTAFDEVTCEAGAFDGGHTKSAMADQSKSAGREACTARVLERARALRSPASMAHLYNEKWCRKRDITPLKRKP